MSLHFRHAPRAIVAERQSKCVTVFLRRSSSNRTTKILKFCDVAAAKGRRWFCCCPFCDYKKSLHQPGSTPVKTTASINCNTNTHYNHHIMKTGWANTWDTIISTGAKFWKVDDIAFKQQALQKIVDYATPTIRDDGKLNIFCPLAGDDQFVQVAWSQGHGVVAMDLVPAAVEQMRGQFGGPDEWTKRHSDDKGADTSAVIWEHSSGRATLYEGDVTVSRPELNGQFDAIYDKDSFGALPLELRRPYCERLAEYAKSGAIVYTEVKNREDAGGPPFHVEKDDLMEVTSFGKDFTHVISLGEVYPIPMPTWTQTGHVLKRI